MSPNTGIAASQLRQLIFYHIDNDFLDNANFLAARLYALEPRNPDSSHLLALTYQRLRRFKAAYDYGQKYGANGRHLGCAYVFAQACFELGRNLEGAGALEKARALWGGRSHWNKHSENSRRHLPDAPAAHTLLAKLWRNHGDMRRAGDNYIEAHKMNPFIWDSFEGLCKIGADLNIQNMFKPTPEMLHGQGAVQHSNGTEIWSDEPVKTHQPLAPQVNFNQNVLTLSDDPFNPSRLYRENDELAVPGFALPQSKALLRNGLRPPVTSEWDTPTTHNGYPDEDVIMSGVMLEPEEAPEEPPAAPPRRAKTAMQRLGIDRLKASEPALRRKHLSSSENMADDDTPHLRRQPSTHKRTISGHASNASTASTVIDPAAQPRRSHRLFSQATTATTTRRDTTAAETAGRVERTVRTAKAATAVRGRTGIVGRVVSGNRNKHLPPDPAEKEKRAPSRNSEKSVTVPSLPEVTTAYVSQPPKAPEQSQADALAEQEALTGLLDNFRRLAVGVYSNSRFDTPAAIQTFRSLPTAQRETPWVLAQLGKAHYEAADYKAAEDCFARVLKLQPSRVEDMEVYSTVLWHLKKEPALAFLCHLMRDQSFHAPQTWCAVGNAFSLAREHDQAISAFKRATQLDENFAYAWTLMGHEHLANEDIDAATQCFRKCVAREPRSYGGWYGLGKCAERLDHVAEAEHNYRIAAAINPSNATLLVCIGVVLERQHERKAALAQYARALELCPTSALARFKKARVLLHLRLYDDALAQLEVLRGQAPDEANVWFLLGKCYKGLQLRGEAVRAFTTALNLDVKAAAFIKEAMEALDDDEKDGSWSD